jgi:hypothetical protein
MEYFFRCERCGVTDRAKPVSAAVDAIAKRGCGKNH